MTDRCLIVTAILAHRYVFVLYALDAATNLAPGASEQELRKAIAGHVLAEGKLTGIYQR